MTQLTIRGFDPELERHLRNLARERGVSLNKAALWLMRRGAGLDEARPATIGDQLDAFFGDWTEAESEAFLDAISVFETIDDEVWS